MFEIIETKDKGNDSIVIVKVFLERVDKVEGVSVANIDKSSAYHQTLHDDRIDHSHKTTELTVTLLIDNPVTDTKITSATAYLNNTKIPGEENESDTHVERYYVNDGQEERDFYSIGSVPRDIINTLQTDFPSENINDFLWMSSSSYNSVLKENVITAFHKSNVDGLKNSSEMQRYKNGVISHVHKFFMETKRVGTRVYSIATENYSCVPDWCETLAIGEDFEKDQTTPMDFGYLNIYFKGDPNRVEEEFSLERRRGEEATFYAITVNKSSNEVLRVKQYCYDYRTIFSGWELTAARVKKDIVKLHE
jgi:hypothetical protein|tara:strand:+ start:73 stop:993 length:921 start_codon:yes stop_codon:yes gene_type:complete